MIIALSRQFGAGSRTIGARLSQQLGYRLLDEDIRDLKSDSMKVAAEKLCRRRGGGAGSPRQAHFR
jgi:shikimate kinase